MPRYKKRQLQWMDIIGRFEAQSHSAHFHNARGLIERLKDEGARFFDEGSEQLRRWQRCCSVLLSFLNNLGQRRDLGKEGLETVMREFIQEFEHSTERMEQMLYGAVVEPDNNEDVRQIRNWINLAYRASTYALLSAWIEDKHDDISLVTTIDLTTGEVRQEGNRTPMRVPPKYKKSTKRF